MTRRWTEGSREGHHGPCITVVPNEAARSLSQPRRGQVTAVAAGVDTLYLSLTGDLDGAAMQVLRRLREVTAHEDVTPFTLDDADGSLNLRPHGWRGYPLWLSSPRYELMVGAAPPFPAAYVQLHSPYIHTLGVDEAAAAVVELVRGKLFGGGTMRVAPSRIDVYADVQGWEPTIEDYGRFVCRAVSRRQFAQDSETHVAGRRLTGFMFGRGDVVARIYNKTIELQTRGETWPLAVWRGADPEAPVWRVEFQYRRKALTTFGLRTLPAVLAARQDLWEYGTRWLSLRMPCADAVRAHWPEAPEWAALRDVEIGAPRSRLVRDRVRGADEDRLLRGLGGYISSLAAAWNEPDMEQAMRRAGPRLHQYWNERGVTFGQLVRIKRSRRPGL
jgi:hypothetical protein